MSPQLIFPRRPWVRLRQSQTLKSNHIPSVCVISNTSTCHLPAHCDSWWAAPSISSDARCHTSGAAGGGRTWCPAGSQAGHGAIHTHKPQHRESEMGTHRLRSCFRHRIPLCFIALRATISLQVKFIFVQSPTSHFRLDARVKTGCSRKLPHIQWMHQNMLPIAPCGMLFFFVYIKPLLITMVIC